MSRRGSRAQASLHRSFLLETMLLLTSHFSARRLLPLLHNRHFLSVRLLLPLSHGCPCLFRMLTSSNTIDGYSDTGFAGRAGIEVG
jgi:hypothetical protein